MASARIYFAVLNMGLGHAARSLPIIKKFDKNHWEILVGSNGRTLKFLQNELPSVKFVVTPDYRIEYSKKNYLLLKLFLQLPRILKKIREEHIMCGKIVSGFCPDIIFSDNCYGAYHKSVPSYFLSHQITFALPNFLKYFQFFPAQFNVFYHNRYNHIFIPDLRDGDLGLLSGELSKCQNSDKRYLHSGILSSIKKYNVAENIDLLISISGPEPQRTILEKMILDQTENLSGNIVIVLGKSEKIEQVHESSNLKIYSHLPRRDFENMFNRAKLIVSRPGYSTIMELVELGKKALLIPTPGQTEQLYLAQRVMKKKWFFCVDQKNLDLVRDIDTASRYSGLQLPDSTEKSVEFIWDKIVGGEKK